MQQDEISEIRVKILDWYARARRELPWRDHPDPYVVWVSEIMLQQTRVETVLPYFERWMGRFPTIASLADARQEEVLSAWEGLGYYSRARNLHKSAGILVERYGGRLPAEPLALQELPGIGRYTAGAICSIAFGLDEPVVDGNIRRVLARIFDVQASLGSAEAEARFWMLAASLLPAGRAGEFNQALMELGALVCLPRSPRCESCPVAGFCRAFELGLQEQRPVKKSRQEQPHYTVAAAVIAEGSRVLITRRPQDALLGGMWEFPGGKIQPGESLGEGLRREISEELGVLVRIGEPCGIYHHAYSHFRVTLHAFQCELVSGTPAPLEASDLRWAAPEELGAYPMGKIDRMISDRIRS